MVFIQGFIYIVFGVVFIWMGAFLIITAMLPKEFAMTVAEKHGTWIRENVFNLPESDIDSKK
jgi:hypothetical protein